MHSLPQIKLIWVNGHFWRISRVNGPERPLNSVFQLHIERIKNQICSVHKQPLEDGKHKPPFCWYKCRSLAYHAMQFDEFLTTILSREAIKNLRGNYRSTVKVSLAWRNMFMTSGNRNILDLSWARSMIHETTMKRRICGRSIGPVGPFFVFIAFISMNLHSDVERSLNALGWIAKLIADSLSFKPRAQRFWKSLETVQEKAGTVLWKDLL